MSLSNILHIIGVGADDTVFTDSLEMVFNYDDGNKMPSEQYKSELLCPIDDKYS